MFLPRSFYINKNIVSNSFLCAITMIDWFQRLVTWILFSCFSWLWVGSSCLNKNLDCKIKLSPRHSKIVLRMLNNCSLRTDGTSPPFWLWRQKDFELKKTIQEIFHQLHRLFCHIFYVANILGTNVWRKFSIHFYKCLDVEI